MLAQPAKVQAPDYQQTLRKTSAKHPQLWLSRSDSLALTRSNLGRIEQWMADLIVDSGLYRTLRLLN